MYTLAEYIFFVLMCLPVIILGIWSFSRILKDIVLMNRAEKRDKQRAEEKKNEARIRQKKINDNYRRRRGG
jgi:hypothetical protein